MKEEEAGALPQEKRGRCSTLCRRENSHIDGWDPLPPELWHMPSINLPANSLKTKARLSPLHQLSWAQVTVCCCHKSLDGTWNNVLESCSQSRSSLIPKLRESQEHTIGGYSSAEAKEETSTAAACSLQLAIYWEMFQPSQEHWVDLALLPFHRLSLPNISPCSKEEAEGEKDMERASPMNNEVSNVRWK